MRIYTVGHSTRLQSEFVALLAAHGVRRLADVRTMPRSRHNPQFNSDELAAALGEAGIEYVHLPALGGLRHTTPASVNLGWRNKSFRGYADYIQTEAFANAIAGLIALASSASTAIMCAEAVPWRCHRSLIADALLGKANRGARDRQHGAHDSPCADVVCARGWRSPHLSTGGIAVGGRLGAEALNARRLFPFTRAEWPSRSARFGESR
jgi:uncharacterized protein (DUF488 family)